MKPDILFRTVLRESQTVMEKCVTMATITSMTPNVDDHQFLFY